MIYSDTNKNSYHVIDSPLSSALQAGRYNRRNRDALDLVELQKETDELPNYAKRQWEFVVRQVRSSSEKIMRLTMLTNVISQPVKVFVHSEDLQFGPIPGVQPYSEFTRAYLSFKETAENGDEHEAEKDISIGHVLRDTGGETHFVTGFFLHFDPSITTLTEDPLVEQGR